MYMYMTKTALCFANRGQKRCAHLSFGAAGEFGESLLRVRLDGHRARRGAQERFGRREAAHSREETEQFADREARPQRVLLRAVVEVRRERLDVVLRQRAPAEEYLRVDV